MKFSRKNLTTTAALGAAIEPLNIFIMSVSACSLLVSAFASEWVAPLLASVVCFLLYLFLVMGMMKKNAKKYGDKYFQALHHFQISELEAKLKGLTKTPLVKKSEQLLRMYWDLRLSGGLSDTRKDTLGEATERYFEIMISSLSALARLPEGSEGIKKEEAKLSELSRHYQDALISECVTQTSSGDKEGFNELISKLEAIKFSNETVRG